MDSKSTRWKKSIEVENEIGRLQAALECPICLEMMITPVSTRCHHYFCQACLLQVLSNCKSAPCPLCKELFTRRSLQKLDQLATIVSKVRGLIDAFQLDTGYEFCPSRHVVSSTIPCPSKDANETSQAPCLGAGIAATRERACKRKSTEDYTEVEEYSRTASRMNSPENYRPKRKSPKTSPSVANDVSVDASGCDNKSRHRNIRQAGHGGRVSRARQGTNRRQQVQVSDTGHASTDANVSLDDIKPDATAAAAADLVSFLSCASLGHEASPAVSDMPNVDSSCSTRWVLSPSAASCTSVLTEDLKQQSLELNPLSHANEQDTGVTERTSRSSRRCLSRLSEHTHPVERAMRSTCTTNHVVDVHVSCQSPESGVKQHICHNVDKSCGRIAEVHSVSNSLNLDTTNSVSMKSGTSSGDDDTTKQKFTRAKDMSSHGGNINNDIISDNSAVATNDISHVNGRVTKQQSTRVRGKISPGGRLSDCHKNRKLVLQERHNPTGSVAYSKHNIMEGAAKVDEHLIASNLSAQSEQEGLITASNSRGDVDISSGNDISISPSNTLNAEVTQRHNVCAGHNKRGQGKKNTARSMRGVLISEHHGHEDDSSAAVAQRQNLLRVDVPSDDPYAFKVSQRTPKQMSKRGRAKRKSVCKRKLVIELVSGGSKQNVQHTPIKGCDNEDMREIQQLTESIALAEQHELMLSQQFRDLEKEAREESVHKCEQAETSQCKDAKNVESDAVRKEETTGKLSQQNCDNDQVNVFTRKKPLRKRSCGQKVDIECSVAPAVQRNDETLNLGTTLDGQKVAKIDQKSIDSKKVAPIIYHGKKRYGLRERVANQNIDMQYSPNLRRIPDTIKGTTDTIVEHRAVIDPVVGDHVHTPVRRSNRRKSFEHKQDTPLSCRQRKSAPARLMEPLGNQSKLDGCLSRSKRSRVSDGQVPQLSDTGINDSTVAGNRQHTLERCNDKSLKTGRVIDVDMEEQAPEWNKLITTVDEFVDTGLNKVVNIGVKDHADTGLTELADTGVNELPDTGLNKLADPRVKVPADTGLKEPAGDGLNGLTDNGLKELVGTGQNELTDTGLNELADIGLKELTDNAQKLTDTGLNELPDTGLNGLTNNEKQLADTGQNQLTDTGLNELVDTGQNELADTGLNELVNTGLNGLTNSEKELTDTELNELTSTELNELADARYNELTETALNELADTGLNELVHTALNELADNESKDLNHVELADTEHIKLADIAPNEPAYTGLNELADNGLNELTDAELNGLNKITPEKNKLVVNELEEQFNSEIHELAANEVRQSAELFDTKLNEFTNCRHKELREPEQNALTPGTAKGVVHISSSNMENVAEVCNDVRPSSELVKGAVRESYYQLDICDNSGQGNCESLEQEVCENEEQSSVQPLSKASGRAVATSHASQTAADCVVVDGEVLDSNIVREIKGGYSRGDSPHECIDGRGEEEEEEEEEEAKVDRNTQESEDCIISCTYVISRKEDFDAEKDGSFSSSVAGSLSSDIDDLHDDDNDNVVENSRKELRRRRTQMIISNSSEDEERDDCRKKDTKHSNAEDDAEDSCRMTDSNILSEDYRKVVDHVMVSSQDEDDIVLLSEHALSTKDDVKIRNESTRKSFSLTPRLEKILPAKKAFKSMTACTVRRSLLGSADDNDYECGDAEEAGHSLLDNRDDGLTDVSESMKFKKGSAEKMMHVGDGCWGNKKLPDKSELECLSSAMYKMHSPTSSNSKVHTPTSIKSKVHTSTSSKSIVHVPTSSKFRVHTPTSLRSRVHSPTSSKSRVNTPTSAKSSIHTPTSTKSRVHTPTSDKSSIHTPTSAKSRVHTPTSTKSRVHTPTSTKAIVHTPTSSKSRVHTPSSAKSIIHTPTSTRARVHTPTSSKSRVHTPSSAKSIIHTPASTKSRVHTPTSSKSRNHSLPASLPVSSVRRAPLEVLTALPTTPAKPVCLDNRDYESREEWDRIYANIAMDLNSNDVILNGGVTKPNQSNDVLKMDDPNTDVIAMGGPDKNITFGQVDVNQMDDTGHRNTMDNQQDVTSVCDVADQPNVDVTDMVEFDTMDRDVKFDENVTVSSNESSLSEILTTQQHVHLEEDILRIQAQIKALQAEVGKPTATATSDETLSGSYSSHLVAEINTCGDPYRKSPTFAEQNTELSSGRASTVYGFSGDEKIERSQRLRDVPGNSCGESSREAKSDENIVRISEHKEPCTLTHNYGDDDSNYDDVVDQDEDAMALSQKSKAEKPRAVDSDCVLCEDDCLEIGHHYHRHAESDVKDPQKCPHVVLDDDDEGKCEVLKEDKVNVESTRKGSRDDDDADDENEDTDSVCIVDSEDDLFPASPSIIPPSPSPSCRSEALVTSRGPSPLPSTPSSSSSSISSMGCRQKEKLRSSALSSDLEKARAMIDRYRTKSPRGDEHKRDDGKDRIGQDDSEVNNDSDASLTCVADSDDSDDTIIDVKTCHTDVQDVTERSHCVTTSDLVHSSLPSVGSIKDGQSSAPDTLADVSCISDSETAHATSITRRTVAVDRKLPIAEVAIVDNEPTSCRKLPQEGATAAQSPVVTRRSLLGVSEVSPCLGPRLKSVLPHMASSSTMTVTRGDVAFVQKPGWLFVASGISELAHKRSIEEFAQALGCRFGLKYSSATTHVLVMPELDDPRRCQRTLKYFQGIAGGRWVLSLNWVLDSLSAGCCKPMESYEILADTSVPDVHRAPRLSRLSSSPLLPKHEICCYGGFKNISKDELHGLVESCGAMVVQQPTMFTFSPSCQQVVLVDTENSQRLDDLKRLHRKYEVHILQKEWMLDSIGTYSVQPKDQYSIFDQPPRNQR